MKTYLKKHIPELIGFTIYSIITLTLVFYHEIWGDEAQAWLIAKNLSFIDMFKQLLYEGHPSLWYLILFPFAHLRFPIITLNIISCLIMITTTYLILFKSPINRVLKFLIIFSFPFIYLYSVTSRSYCLIPLLLSLIAINYKNRKNNPIKYSILLMLLANTHVAMACQSFVLAIFFFYENRKRITNKNFIISLIIYILGFLIMCSQIIGALFLCNLVTNNNHYLSFLIKAITIFMKYFVNLDFYDYYNIDASNLKFLFYLPVVFMSILLIRPIIKCKKLSFLFLSSFLFQIIIHLKWRWVLSYRGYLILIILIFFAWIYNYEYKQKKPLRNINIIIAMMCIFSMYSCKIIKYDYLNDYSPSLKTAKYIENNFEEGSVFVNVGYFTNVSTIAYINENKNMKFYDASLKKYYTFLPWNKSDNFIYSIEQLKQTIRILRLSNKNVYIIHSYSLDEYSYYDMIIDEMLKRRYISLLFNNDFESYKIKERFNIYIIND